MMAEPANGDPTLGKPTAFVSKGDGSFPFTFEGAISGSYLVRISLPDFGILSITGSRTRCHRNRRRRLGRR